LIKNLADYLLGIDCTPEYVLKVTGNEGASEGIAGWWFERWARSRAERAGVLEQVALHTPVYPVRHGARVKLPPAWRTSHCSLTKGRERARFGWQVHETGGICVIRRAATA
jgi:hypothetical protein